LSFWQTPNQALFPLIHNFDFVTTLYDFYGFKGLSDNETKKTLEEKIKNGIKQGQQHKIIPYVQKCGCKACSTNFHSDFPSTDISNLVILANPQSSPLPKLCPFGNSQATLLVPIV
jgi:hypothetical protein